MTTRDFEKAIDALGVSGLEVTKVSYGINGQVVAVYGVLMRTPVGGADKQVPTFLKWDMNGRGFRFDLNPNEECCISTGSQEYLDYRRDDEFDLTF
jgi:hypothetical protein